jgi:hypothetical protein
MGASQKELADLAQLMKHSRRVQESWYDLSLKTDQTKRACISISETLSVSTAITMSLFSEYYNATIP